MRKDNRKLARSRLELDTVLSTIDNIAKYNLKTLMLQSGQDSKYDSETIKKIIIYARQKGISNIILCIGYRSVNDYREFFACGANKYIMKFETSNANEYTWLKNGEKLVHRLDHIEMLKRIGYVIGSGNICGLPQQSENDLYNDLMVQNKLNGGLASVSPFISHIESPLRETENADINKTLNYLALMRIVLKNALIPAVSAFEILREGGQLDALKAGANVITVNMTPETFRGNYPIYNTNRKIVEFNYAKEISKAASLNVTNENN